MARSSTPTKAKILEASRTLLSLHGYENTTIDDIMAASGITKGAFYHYFKTKEALGQEVIVQAMQEYQSLTESLESQAAPIEKLTSLIRTLCKLNSQGDWLNCRLMLRLLTEPHDETPGMQAELNTFWLWYRSFLNDLIIRCRETGQLPMQVPAAAQTNLLISMLLGLCALGQIAPDTPLDMAEHVIAAMK
jgi:TetR/AcrR family transcriptional repressor of nem operon